MIEYVFEEVGTDAGGSGLATITLNRPAARNALDEQALRDLDAAYARAEADGARAVLLRGEGRSARAATSPASIRAPMTRPGISTHC